MKRVHILCEGQTEEQFVKNLLAPFLNHFDVFADAKILVTKQSYSGRNEKGGVSTYSKIARELKVLCKDHSACVTTMLDLYKLPNDTPGMEDKQSDPIQYALHIEKSIDQDIGYPNCHSNITVHEFEALLFSDPSAFSCLGEAKIEEKIRRIKDTFTTPEHINSSIDSAPSKRILRLKSDYKKTSQGIEIAKIIGIEKMKENCLHFSEWIDNIIKIAQ